MIGEQGMRRGLGSMMATAPRRTNIMGEPHMLAYINPQEERMLYAAGGSGEPGPSGIPAFRGRGAGDPRDFGGTVSALSSYEDSQSLESASDNAPVVYSPPPAVFSFPDDDDYTPTSAELDQQLLDQGLPDLRSDTSVIDFSRTGSGGDFTTAAQADTDVSGFEYGFAGDVDSDPSITLASSAPIPVFDDLGREVGVDVFYDSLGRTYSTQDAATQADVNRSAVSRAQLDYSNPDVISQYNYASPSVDFMGLDTSVNQGNLVGYSMSPNTSGATIEIAPDGTFTLSINPNSKAASRVATTTGLSSVDRALGLLEAIENSFGNVVDSPSNPIVSTGTGQVGVDPVTGDIVEYGFDDIDNMINALESDTALKASDTDDLFGDDTSPQLESFVPESQFKVFATPDGVVTRDEVEASLFGEDYTPTSADLAAQLEGAGLTNITPGSLSVEDQVAQYGAGDFTESGLTDDDMGLPDASVNETLYETLTGNNYNDLDSVDKSIVDSGDFTVVDIPGAGESGTTETLFVPTSNSSILEYTIDKQLGLSGDDYNVLGSGIGDAQFTSPDLEDAPKVTISDIQDPSSTTITDPKVLQNLADSYAALEGRDPGSLNAAEARLIQDVLNNSNIRMDEARQDRIITTMRKNGASSAQIRDFINENPIGSELYGGDGSFFSDLENAADDVISYLISSMTYGLIDPSKMNASTAQRFIKAYKDTGQFAYDSENPDVVIGVYDDDGSIVRGFSDFQNTEGGAIRFEEPAETGGDDEGDDGCPPGFSRNPITGVCEPIESATVGSTPSISLGEREVRPRPDPIVTDPRPSGEGVMIRTPSFQEGGIVTPNIDNFLRSLGG